MRTKFFWRHIGKPIDMEYRFSYTKFIAKAIL